MGQCIICIYIYIHEVDDLEVDIELKMRDFASMWTQNSKWDILLRSGHQIQNGFFIWKGTSNSTWDMLFVNEHHNTCVGQKMGRRQRPRPIYTVRKHRIATRTQWSHSRASKQTNLNNKQQNSLTRLVLEAFVTLLLKRQWDLAALGGSPGMPSRLPHP